MSTPLRPLNFVVDTLLSQGLHILAGSPKVGKSWLALRMALDVAAGKPFLGNTTLKGDVLFAEVAPKCSYISPVPGGVGPMTIAALMNNTFKACRQKL